MPLTKRILIATIGSLGDLHPCLGLARELTRRGHRVTVASSGFYRAKVESLGLAFRPLRPDWDPSERDLIRKCENMKKGPEILYRQMILPHLRETYEDLFALAKNADLMIAGEIVYAAPLVAEKLSLPWVSAILSPFSFFSAFDPSMLPNVPALMHLRKAGPAVYRAALNLGRMATRHWSNPVRDLRREQGLRPECDPVFRDKFSPNLVLAMFSRSLARPQRDWPVQTQQTGFVYFKDPAQAAESAQLAAFLAAGEAPVVFTQGSTAVHNPGLFYQVSAEAARRLHCRAVLLGVDSVPDVESDANQNRILALPYAAYDRVFSAASVIVHQGGSGTTGEALRAGRPMLIVPYGWDQPDNAMRIERLGTGLHVPRLEYTVARATTALSELLDNPRFSTQALAVQKEMQTEDGLNSACDAIEAATVQSKEVQSDDIQTNQAQSMA